MATSKKRGIKSSAQDNFLEPSAPTGVSATDVGTSRAFNDGAATVSFSLPANSPAATSFTATATAAGQTTRTATGASSPLTVTGLASNVAYSVTVTASNASGTSTASSAASVTATTVPATMSAPTATAGVNQDTVSWSAPANGGKSITTYRWTSSDGKTGTTSSTSVTVSQESGTAQTYQVRAENANGNGAYSSSSNSVTTQAPFFPPFFPYFPSFGPFFPPFFPFFPYFPSFGPFFPPFFPFFGGPFFPSFGPFFPSFGPYFFFDSIASGTMILTKYGYRHVETLEVGDVLISLDIAELSTTGMDNAELANWSSETFTPVSEVETTITSIVKTTKNRSLYQINSDWYTATHHILVRKEGNHLFVLSSQIDDSYEIYSYSSQDWVPITSINVIEATNAEAYSINCEPYDIFFTQDGLVYNVPESDNLPE